jgi:chromosome segregation ATPase
MNNVTRGHFGRGRSSVDSTNTPTGGDGGDNGMLERVVRLETDVEYIRRDMAEVKESAKNLMADTTDIKVRLEKLAGRQDIFESKLDAMDQKLGTLDKRFEAIDKKFESKFDGLDKKFATKEDLQTALHNQTKWLIVSMLTIVAGAIGFLKYLGV